MSAREKVLITGGSGMVGKNLISALDCDRYEVLAPTSLEVDLSDKRSAFNYIEKHCPGIVVHAAGIVGGIQANLAEPIRFLTKNLEIGANTILASLNAGVGSFINLSSSCVYPKDIGSNLTEDDILSGKLEPTNEGYALAKITAMRLCDFVRREYPELNYKSVVPCNLYGPWDKFDPKNSHLIPAIIHKVHDARQNQDSQIEIWGDGTARREFMYVGDLVDGLAKAVADPCALPDTMNMGLGYDFSIQDYYEAVAGVVGWSGSFTYNLSKPVGMKQKLLNVGRQRAWGWQPTTPLVDGIKRTYQFYLKGHSQ